MLLRKGFQVLPDICSPAVSCKDVDDFELWRNLCRDGKVLVLLLLCESRRLHVRRRTRAAVCTQLSGIGWVLARWMRLAAPLHSAHMDAATPSVTFSFLHVKSITYLLPVNCMGHQLQLGTRKVCGLELSALTFLGLATFALSSCLSRALHI